MAVVQSRQPGYFHYHERSDRVRKVEEGDLLNKKLAEIKRVEKQIKQVQAQMAKAEKPPAAADGKQMHTFKQVKQCVLCVLALASLTTTPNSPDPRIPFASPLCNSTVVCRVQAARPCDARELQIDIPIKPESLRRLHTLRLYVTEC